MDDKATPTHKVITLKDRRIIEAATEIMASPPIGDEIAFLHSTFCQVGLPRSKVAGTVFERRSGTAAIRLEAGSLWNGHEFEPQPLPYGTRPRLLLMHIIRTYLRTGERVINLGESTRDFLVNVLNTEATGGPRGTITAFKAQTKAFAAARMMIGYNTGDGAARTRPERLVEEFETWPETPGLPGQKSLWRNELMISQDFAESIKKASVPLDARAIRAIQDSALALDVYAWLAHRLHRLDRPAQVYWANLREQFGHEFSDPKGFKSTFKKSLLNVLNVYPHAKIELVTGGLRLSPSLPPVPKIRAVVGVDLKTIEHNG